MDGWMDGRMVGGQMDGWVDGRMGGWWMMGGWISRDDDLG